MAHYPQAVFADQGTRSLLLGEVTNLRYIDELPVTSTTCLLATGEISELSDPASVQGHPVLAFTAGQLGDSLRLVSLVKQQWTWAKGEEVVVVLNAPDTHFEKEFTQSRGEPISCVKFAIDVKRPDPIRWLIVQKASYTTIYEPELHEFDSGRGEARAKLFSNPLATLRRTHTGGGAHSDFAFRSISGEAPQLVIVDELGYWSLWEAGRRKAVGRPHSLELALQMHGNIYSGNIPQPLPGTAQGGNNGNGTHKLLFLCAKKYRSRRQSQSFSQDTLEIAHKTTADEGIPMPFLLVSNGTSLYQNDLRTEESTPVLQSYLPSEAKILDIAKSNLDPSEAFILTTKDLLWISAEETKRQEVSLDVLMACPHRKASGVPTAPGALRLELSPGTYINGQKGCVVCIRSSQDTQMTVFWLIKSKTEGVQYRREVINVRAPSLYIGMAMLAVDRAHQEGNGIGGLALRLAEAKARFFQILLMSKDLSVSSALCVWSDDPDLKIRPPDVKVYVDEEESRKERAEYLSDLNQGPNSSKNSPVTQEYVFGPRTVDLKIPFTFNKTGAWQGLEFGGDSQIGDLEMKDGQNPWVDKLRSLFDSLPKEASNQVESAIEAIAAQILHEEIDMSALPRSGVSGTQAGESQRGNTYSSHSQDFFFSSSQFQTQSSQAFPPSSQFPPSSPGIPNENKTDDPIVNYLRQYVHIGPQLPREPPSALLGPFQWDIGGDPRHIDWRPGEQSLDEVLARAIRRKKKAEAKRRKKDKLAAMVLGTGIGTGEDSEHGSSSMAPPLLRASAQAQSSQLPRIMVSSSQVDRDRGMSSSMGPVFSSQVGAGGASQIRSQVFGGRFGDRKKKKDVKKKTGVFR